VPKHKVTLAAHDAEDLGGTPTAGPGMVAARFVRPEERASLTLGSATRRLAARLG
jgi:hypothetical protein